MLEEDNLGGVELIDAVELDKLLVDRNYYKDKFNQYKVLNQRLAKEVAKLTKLIYANKKNK
ncbi:MAG: hypothetical protein CMP21_08875 [Rickettsiales bacterium]|nr:hypothetical protein [Rickettsiales bacterium]